MSKKRSFIVLLAVISMTFMATLDASIVNIALSVLSNELNVTLSAIEWVVVSYSIVICGTILFFGRLGDVIGKTRIFKIGTVIFTLASLLCGLCNSFYWLVFFRFIQGIGASAYMANNHGIITELCPAEKRGKALGILITSVAVGNMLGPSLGGVILSTLNWNSIFYINVPIGILVFILGIKYLPSSEKKQEKIDYKGGILQFVGTTLFFGFLTASQKFGLANSFIWIGIILSIIIICLFVVVEKRQNQPLLDIEIFNNWRFSSNLICAFASFLCLAASYILIPFYLQKTMGLTPIQAGMFIMLSPLILALSAPIFGSLSDKVEPEKVILIGLLILSVGFLLMSTLNINSKPILCTLFICTIALGQSIFQPANNSLIMSSCSKNKLGIVGSVNSLVRNLGQIMGITLSTTLLYGFMSFKIGYRVYDYIDNRHDVFVFGMNNVYRVLFCICILGASLIAFRLIKKSHKRSE